MTACERCGEASSRVRECPQCSTLVCSDHLLPGDHDCITIQATRRNIGDPPDDTTVESETVENLTNRSPPTQPIVPGRAGGTDGGDGDRHLDGSPVRPSDAPNSGSPDGESRADEGPDGRATEGGGAAAKLALVVVVVLLFVIGLYLI